ncbi:hypothetical protein MYX07_02560 [Patescibacteria group bacterium AH-259-L07]|nr:hypothetical protein [Patescibacteria group bacterium AH-259-L07]
MAQLHVYFKYEIKDLAEFETTDVNEKHGNVHKKCRYKGVRVYRDRGVWYTSDFDLEDPIPERILKDITDVSFHDYLPISTQREIGIYRDGRRFGDAVGELKEPTGSSYPLEIRAKGPKNVAKLYYAIRNGSVRPKESWESEQSGKSRQELKAELKRLELIVRGKSALLESESLRMKREIERLSEISQGLWPWCAKSALRNLLNEFGETS